MKYIYPPYYYLSFILFLQTKIVLLPTTQKEKALAFGVVKLLLQPQIKRYMRKRESSAKEKVAYFPKYVVHCIRKLVTIVTPLGAVWLFITYKWITKDA